MSAADDVIAYGMLEVGKPYVYGDEGPSSFDCSGLMQWIFNKVGKKLPRTAAEQQKFATPVNDPKPGDLVFWGAPAYHVGLYLGGGRILAAPQAGDNVKVQKVWGNPTYGRISGLGNASGPVGAVTGAIGTVATPIGLGVAGMWDKITNHAKVGVFQMAGITLIGLGLWAATRGKE